MQKRGKDERAVKKEMLRYFKKDHHYADGTILSSMSTTPANIALWAHSLFIESNLGNPRMFPGTAQLERKVIKWLGMLMHNPHVYGKMLSGGTESNITALWMASKRNPDKKLVLIPETAHFSIMKAIDLMQLKVKILPINENFVIDTTVLNEIDPALILAVVGIAGSTEFGTIDPITTLAQFAEKNDIFLHIDAAFGGFIIPFLKLLGYSMPKFDFELTGVNSIAVDPHKMGTSTNGAGALLLRDNYFTLLKYPSPYLTIKYSNTLLGTRNSASVAATYAVLKFMGVNGFTRLVQSCMDNTQYLSNLVEDYGLELLLKPVLNIVNIKVKNPKKLSYRLKPRWIVSYNEKYKTLRVVVMPHVTKRVIDNFVKDLKNTGGQYGLI